MASPLARDLACSLASKAAVGRTRSRACERAEQGRTRRGVIRALARLAGMALDAATGSAPRLLTIEQVADLCQVSTKTVYRAIRSGALKACRLGRGGAYRVKPEEMERWIEACIGAARERPAPRVAPPPAEPSAPPARRRSSPRSGSDGRLRVAPRMGGAS